MQQLILYTYQILKGLNGTIIDSEVGPWKASIGASGSVPRWFIEKDNLNQINKTLFSAGAPNIYIETTFEEKINGSLDMRMVLFVGGEKRSFTKFPFNENPGLPEKNGHLSNESNVQGLYLEVIDSLIQQSIAENIKKWGKSWLKIKLGDDKDWIEPEDEETEKWKQQIDNNQDATEAEAMGYEDRGTHFYKEMPLQDVLKSNNETQIVNFAKNKRRFKANDLLAIYDKAKELKSNKLLNLVKQLAPLAESLTFKNFSKILNEEIK